MKYVATKKDFEIMTAWDLMTAEPYSINVDQNIEGVFRILEEKKISAIPVVNEKRQLIGVISQT
ncbi:MAG: HPP family protein, partial [Candidatus Sericytochromatia bacterium]